MKMPTCLAHPFALANLGADRLVPLFSLAIRLYVAWVFMRSGLLKIQSWESTLYLFENEYAVPLLPPVLAAWMGAAAELLLPPFIALGLGTRFFAFALFVFNVVAATSYPNLTASALKDHDLWGVLMLVILFHGPGRYSIDSWIKGRKVK